MAEKACNMCNTENHFNNFYKKYAEGKDCQIEIVLNIY